MMQGQRGGHVRGPDGEAPLTAGVVLTRRLLHETVLAEWGEEELRAQLGMRGGDAARCGHLRSREELAARVLQLVRSEPDP
jgi:hypothetical protein